MLNQTLPILVTMARCGRLSKAEACKLLSRLDDNPEARRLGELLAAGAVEAETQVLTEKLAAIRSLAGVEPPPQPAEPQMTLFEHLINEP